MDYSNDYQLVPITVQSKTAGFSETIQLIDNPPDLNNIRQPRRQYRKGWRGGMLWGILATVVVLVSSLAITTLVSRQTETSPGIHVLYQGSCSTSKHINTGTHVVMNVLSTLLLGASNFCMTVLSSPTRKEVDYWHSRKVAMDIGINSVRNLFKVSITRRMPWLVLVCTSVPLHLFFNSAIYSATSTYTYTASVVTDDFFDGQFWTLDGLVWESASISLPVTDPKEYIAWMSEVQAGKIDLDRLENKECVEAYATPWLANRANLIMATSSGKKNITTYNNNSLIVAWGGVYSNEQVGPYSYSAYTWLCSDSEYPSGPEAQCSDLVKYPGNFSVMAWVQDAQYPNGSTSGFTSTIQVEYCLSQKVPERCTVESSIAIWATMICLVAVKLCCLLWTLLVLEDEPMVVPGDCVASFLHRPDLTTLGACLWPADKFRKNSTWMGELRWDSDTMPWRAAVGSRQWTSCLLLSIATMVTVTILLGMGLRTSDSTSSDLFRMGFGDPNLRFSLSSTFGAGSNSALALICAVLLANTPQLLITFVYFTYNSVFTSMVMASEWSQFAFQRKPLRVSNPTGRQQSTYRLQLPYRYGVPLMLLIVTLHWLISQSIFVLRIKVLDFQGIEDTGSSLTTCGYSLTAVLTAIITGGFAIMILVAHGTLRRYKPGMTLVGSSTAAISAACHPMPTEDADASLGELQWGVVPLGHEDEVGHCTFSAGPVSFPVEGRLYS